MVRLRKDSRGNYVARKRLPDDVRQEYGELHGQSYEVKFYAPASTKRQEAERQFHEWKADTDARIAAIRAQRTGEGIPLTRQQARALAGKWYDWFLARHAASDKEWDHSRDQVQDAMRGAVGKKLWEENHPDELWEQDEELRKAVRPVLADVGETAQFLAAEAKVLDNNAREQFLDFLYKDLAEALRRLIRLSEGDYSPDSYRERFPKAVGSDNSDKPTQLFERWAKEREAAAGTVENWQYFFRSMEEHFKDRSAASITPTEAQQWIKGMISPSRKAATVNNTWLNASHTVFGWAAEHGHIPTNPFAGVKITVPRQIRLRDTQAFYPQEQRLILKATLDVTDTRTPDAAARRWVPWLCAYTGARVGEMTQLRGSDLIERDGIHALRITPDAGTTKNRKTRVVPLHDHLVEQGFLEFAAKHGDKPLFYMPRESKKSPYAQARQRLADWVRGLGITDKEVSPNHGWRHTFKQIADHAEISERTSNYITGHAQRNEGSKYGAPTVKQMADAMRKFPRYELEEPHSE
jgi:integrase